MDHPDFNLKALYTALDEQRRARDLSWAEATQEIRRLHGSRPLATSTITSLRDKETAEGDGILQMLFWLGRPPESFVDDLEWDDESARLPDLTEDQNLRWDLKAIHLALNTQRTARGMTWEEVADEVGGYNADGLRRMSKGGRTGFPRVMRIVRWLNMPAANFIHITDW